MRQREMHLSKYIDTEQPCHYLHVIILYLHETHPNVVYRSQLVKILPLGFLLILHYYIRLLLTVICYPYLPKKDFLKQLALIRISKTCLTLLFLFNRYLVFVARVTLAAIDHNMHVFRPHAKTADGKFKYARKYSKRTKKWHAEPVKSDKE